MNVKKGRSRQVNVTFQKDIIDLQNLIDQDIGEDMGEDDDVSEDGNVIVIESGSESDDDSDVDVDWVFTFKTYFN